MQDVPEPKTRVFRRGRVLRWGSVALLASALALWAASYHWVPMASTGNWAGGPRLNVAFFRGSLVTQAWSLVAEPSPPAAGLEPQLGFVLADTVNGWWFGRLLSWVVGSVRWAPMWAVTAPLVALVWWAWRQRAAAGLCPNCGYDLAGVPGGVCPECGTLQDPCASSTSQRG